MPSWSQVEGSPQPLGSTWLESERCFNFALYSRHATSVTLLLYTTDDLINPVRRITLDHLLHKSGSIWHCRLAASEVAEACYYAYSVEGANIPAAEFHAFDPLSHWDLSLIITMGLFELYEGAAAVYKTKAVSR